MGAWAGERDAVAGSFPAPVSSVEASVSAKEVPNYSLESGITGSTNVLYFLITADNGFGSEGPLGYATGPTARTADAYCNK